MSSTTSAPVESAPARSAAARPNGPERDSGPGALLRPLLGGFALLALFVAVDLLWGAALTTLEARWGLPLESGGGHATVGTAADAAWHLATGFAIALPTANRRLWALTPPLALALDVDHVYGIWLPAPFPRVAHCLAFVAIAGVALGLAGGRLGGFAASGAVLVHIGVDGGAFPLFAPVDPVSLGLPYWGQAAFVAASVVFLVLAAGSIRALLMPRYGLAALAVVVGIVLLLVFVVPPNAGFNSV